MEHLTGHPSWHRAPLGPADPEPSWEATCAACRVRSVLRPSAGHLWLYGHGVIAVEWFCPHCYEFNRVPVSADLAMQMTSIGLSTEVVVVPGELLEHPPAGTPPITANEVLRFAVLRTDVMWRMAIGELGL